MKKTLFLSLLALISIGCNNSAPTAPVNTNTTTTSASPTAPKKEDSQTMVAHSSENQKMPAGNSKSDSSSGGSPMQKPVDVSAMTLTIEKAEKDYKAKPTDESAKQTLATAYFTRAFALTDAAQYSAALGDFRKGLKLNPTDQKAKDMHDQIVSIYESLGKGAPKEGEEKAPVQTSK